MAQMPTFIATYDLKETRPDPHQTFIEKAETHGWSAWIKGNGKWYRLPNTTLEGTFDTRDAAVAALKAARTDTEKEIGIAVTMEKWIVAQYGTATFNSDETQAA
jgi:hypothetical protein